MKRMALSLALPLALVACAPEQPPSATGVPPLAAAQDASDHLLDDVRILSTDDMEGRLVGSAGGAKARAYLVSRLKEIGVAPAIDGAFELPFSAMRRNGEVSGINLIGLISGTGGSDRAIVLMAHYDHVGVRNDQIYNGADDNASGVATVLTIAESLKRQAPLHDVIVVLADGEESGMAGSRSMVADPAFKPLLDRTVMAVNLDMVSRSDKDELYVAGAFRFPGLKPYLEEIAAAAPVNLKLGHDDPALGKDDWTGQSDHAAFQQIGRPWVYFGVEDHPDYHQPTDDFAAIPQDFFRRSARTIEIAVRTFDTELETIATESAGAGK